MDTNKMRDVFIRAYRRLLIAEGMKVQESRFELRDGEFPHRETAIAWWAWQASREAVVVDLPEGFDLHDWAPERCSVINRREAAEAIEAQGLKVAP